jgi:predicted kinase
LTRGIPGSGKSTFAREWVQEDPENRVRINRDDLRRTLFATTDTLLSIEQERFVSVVEKDIARDALKRGKDVVVDAMNLNPRWVKDWLKLGYPVRYRDFPVDLDEALDRNAQRENPVPEEVIRKAYARYTAKGDLPRPPLTPTPAKVERYEGDWNLPGAWIFDIDGTLAHMNGRSPYDWARVGEDDVDDSVRAMLRALEMEFHIVLMSGRDESCRSITEQWLTDNGIPFDVLHMRPAGDNRRDDVVKRELFDTHVRAHWNVLGVVDDRNQVVRMWRAMGIKCYQAAEGDF